MNQTGDQPPPVAQGEELDVRIESVGEKGDGIAKKRGFVIFVPKAEKGKELRIRVTKVLKNVSFAEVIGEAKGPVVNPPREFHRDTRAYMQPKKDDDINFAAIGEGSEEF